MDKNFISIDDLVRQRLEGEEERERPAGWLQMRDLLDKEMPQVRGGFYWRRTFGAIALLLLATSISVGGFMFASSIKAENGAIAHNNSVNNTSPTNNNREAINGNDVNNYKESAANAEPSSAAAVTHKKHTTDKTVANEDQQKTAIAAEAEANNKVAVTDSKPAKPASDNNKESNNNNVNNSNSREQKIAYEAINTNNVKPAKEAFSDAVRENKNAHTDVAVKQQNKKITPTAAVKTTDTKATSEKVLAASVKGTHSKKHSSNNEDVKKKQFLAAVVAANEANKKAAKLKKKEVTQQASLTTNNVVHKTTVTGGKSEAGETTANAAEDHTTAIAKVSQPAKGKHTGKRKNQSVTTNDLALGSGTPVTKSVPAVVRTTDMDEAGQPAKHGEHKRVHGSKNNAVGPSVAADKTGSVNKNAAGNKSTAASKNIKVKPVTGSADINEVAAAKIEKKQFDRVIIEEHYFRNSAREGDGYYLPDTISIDKLTRDVASSGNDQHRPSGAKKSEGAKEDDDNSSENSSALAITNSAIVPGAAAATTGKSGLGTKQSQSSKGSGTSAVEKLNATFNDVKYHVAGVQFAPGLTAGINGTFFGPNSFKGFQFGFTGKFTFSEAIGIMTELKYFHRINNNYTLNDNYYTYTQAGAGTWSKQLSSTSYSFSTLHSIELPVTIRYTMSHFTFYAGGNFVYSFAINSGASVQPNNTAPVLVNSVGNDNAPKLHANDFNSRFGMGYLVGLSYEVSPNVSLDFRSVQTVWDNSGSQGAKYISGQLYRSPSFQVSLGYRLGGNKKRD